MKENIEFIKASQDDVNEVDRIYQDIHQMLQDTINYPRWPLGIYPIKEDAINAWQKEELFVLKENDKIIGSVILNEDQQQGYKTVHWLVQASEIEVLVIHTLAIDPSYQSKGYASLMLDHIKAYASLNHYKTIRLDITQDNLPARYLYQKNGFVFTGIADLSRQDAGIDYCEMYEYNLSSPFDKLDYLEKVVDDFLLERDWHKYHNADNLSKSIMIEAAELLECFQWDDDYDREHVLEELADVFIYCFQLSAHLKVNIKQMIESKMEKNRQKYPKNGSLS